MRNKATLFFTIISFTCFGQSIETITDKISNQICDCIKDDITSYSDIKPEFNRCYDKEFNQIFSIADADEQKILVQPGALEKVKNGIIPTLNNHCEKIKRIVQSEMDNSVESAANSGSNPCPVNFTGKDLEKIENHNGEIIAFNGLVTKVHVTHNNLPYYQVKLEGGNTIWIASLLNTGYEKKEKILRILGYISDVKSDDLGQKYNKTGYHILAFCIIDMDSKQMAMLPGSELQIKEWMSGKVPKGKK